MTQLHRKETALFNTIHKNEEKHQTKTLKRGKHKKWHIGTKNKNKKRKKERKTIERNSWFWAKHKNQHRKKKLEKKQRKQEKKKKTPFRLRESSGLPSTNQPSQQLKPNALVTKRRCHANQSSDSVRATFRELARVTNSGEEDESKCQGEVGAKSDLDGFPWVWGSIVRRLSCGSLRLRKVDWSARTLACRVWTDLSSAWEL